MTKTAYLVAPPPGAADMSHDVIGGLPNVQRQTLSLKDAGVEEVITLEGAGGAGGAAGAGEAGRAGSAGPGGNALVARAGCVWHPKLVRRLARTAVGPDEVIAAGADEAAVYLCGRNRVAAVIAALQAGTVAPGDLNRRTALRPEFVILPRIDSERGQATTLLLRSLEKQADGFVSRHLHRPLSRAVTRRLLAWPVTPNAMTLVAAVFGVAGAVVALRGGYWNVLAGALLFELQNVLDGCDGEIARLKYLRSTAGEWLDQIADDVLNIAFLAAIGIALSRDAGREWAWTVTRVAIGAQVVHVTGLYAGLIFKAGGRGSVATLRWWVGGGTATGQGSRFLGDLTRRDFYSLLYVVAAAANLVAVAFVWHALITIGAAVVSTLQWIAWNGPEYQAEPEGADPAEESAA